MIVVVDTSPLNYLIQIDCDGLLPRIYGRIVLPLAVQTELSHALAPEKVKRWLSRRPEWVDVFTEALPWDAELDYLGNGERQAILVSQSIGAELLLIDDLQGRKEAASRGIRTTGTLGVLLDAGVLGFIDAHAAFHHLLSETNFRASRKLAAEYLRREQ